MKISNITLQVLLNEQRSIPEISGNKSEEIFCNPLFVKRYQDFVDPWNTKYSKAEGEIMPLFLVGALKSNTHPQIDSGKATFLLRAGADIRFMKPVIAGKHYRALYRDPILSEIEKADGRKEYLYTDTNAVVYDSEGCPVMDVLCVSRIGTQDALKVSTDKFRKHIYTQKEKTLMQNIMDGEVIRGSTPRYIEDVKPGEKLTEATYGPMTPLDMIFYSGARYSLKSYPLRRLRELKPELVAHNEDNNAFRIWNSYNFTDDAAAAKVTGVPAAFQIPDFSADAMMRTVTNWMGNAAFVERLRWQHLSNTPLYDCAVAKGSVVERTTEDTVQVDVKMDNICRDSTDDTAQFWVKLPSRS